MRRVFLISLATCFFLTACNSAKKPGDENFRKAINAYLAKHGKACTSIGQPFPIDVTQPQQKMQSSLSLQMAALEKAGLVHGTDTTAVVHGMMDALTGPTSQQPVRQYELTDEGRKYFQLSPGIFGQSAGFCYGDKTVNSIVKWTEPVTTGGASQTEVTYTYRIADLASWAERPEIQSAFGDIRSTTDRISKSDEIAGLQLTNQGWEIPGP